MWDYSIFGLFPEPLLFLILAATSKTVTAQGDTLAVNSSVLFNPSNISSSPIALPRTSSGRISVSVALCDSASSDGNGIRFFATNDTSITDPGPNNIGPNVFEIIVGSTGVGNITLEGAGEGGWFATSVDTAQSFEVGTTDNKEPLLEVLSELPLLGDTISNQAILFSPPFDPVAFNEPSFPNYTFPDANSTTPTPPSITPSFTLLLGITSALPSFDVTTNSFEDGTPVTACALKNLQGLQNNPENVQESLVLRDNNGWRTEWLVNGLQPLTNYTAFVLQDDTKVAGPIYFITKSAQFACPLVHALPYCPLVSYAVPLPGPSEGSVYDATSLPQNISTNLLSYLTNFTTSLSSFACGRDLYSPLVSCADCQAAYRTWLCSVSLPRCGDQSTFNISSSISEAESLTSSSSSFFKWLKRETPQQTPLIAPALASQDVNTTRNPFLPEFPGSNWTELLPCLEVCNAAERACPFFVGFQCPLPRFNAASSYGVGYIDGDTSTDGNEWVKGGGTTGHWQDRFGNIWCNGPGV